MIELGCKTFIPFQTLDLHRVQRIKNCTLHCVPCVWTSKEAFDSHIYPMDLAKLILKDFKCMLVYSIHVSVTSLEQLSLVMNKQDEGSKNKE